MLRASTLNQKWISPALRCCSNAWYHVVMTWDSETLTVYINGSVAGSITAVSRTMNGDNMRDNFMLGKPNHVLLRYAQVFLDQMIFLNKNLSSIEVLRLFQSYTEGRWSLLTLVQNVQALHNGLIVFETGEGSKPV